MGVLALQGGFEAHARVLRGLGATVREVRVPADLEGLEGLVIPGGESTTMTLGIEREGLVEPLRELAARPRGRPVLGSCAGLIMLDREHLGLMDMRARRNAFGRQTSSFEARSDAGGLGRRPRLRCAASSSALPGSRSTARGWRSSPSWTATRRGPPLAVAFHSELTG